MSNNSVIDLIIARFKKETGLEKMDFDVFAKGEEIEIHLSYFLTRLKPVQSGYLSPLAAADQIMKSCAGSFQEQRFHGVGLITMKFNKEKSNV